MLLMIVAGRIGRDAETRHSQAGDSYTSFSVAVDMGKDKTEWVNATIKGERGEKLAQYLRKGTVVSLSGLPVADLYQPKEGDAKASLKMWVDKVTFLGKPASNDGYAHEPTSHESAKANGYQEPAFDEEVPF